MRIALNDQLLAPITTMQAFLVILAWRLNLDDVGEVLNIAAHGGNQDGSAGCCGQRANSMKRAGDSSDRPLASHPTLHPPQGALFRAVGADRE